jgi:hypothetical protein
VPQTFSSDNVKFTQFCCGLVEKMLEQGHLVDEALG